MRLFTCLDCDLGVIHETDALKGPLPLRCSEHQQLHSYRLRVKYLAQRKVQQ